MGFGEVPFPDIFNWVSMVDNLAGSDFTKYPLVYESSYEEGLFTLLYRYHLDKYKEQINKRMSLKYGR